MLDGAPRTIKRYRRSDARLCAGSRVRRHRGLRAIRSQVVSSEVDPVTGGSVPDGGFTVTLRLADLSDGALQHALQATKSGSLL